MTNAYYGNSMPAPDYQVAAYTTVDDELQYSTVGFTQKGVTLKPGQGVLLLGTLLKQDAATKMYVKANDNTATGVLRQTTDTGASASAQKWQANIVIAGILNLSKMVAANSSGLALTSVLGARVDTVKGFFKF